MLLPVIQPSRVTIMIKPVGALCNLDCTYCYYLPTKTIYKGHQHRMSLRTLEEVFASILPRFDQDVTIAWQGGEPTLAGLDFFRQAMAFQQTYKRPGQRIHHGLQTNGTLLDDQWCGFLRQNQFLVGLSVDGPPRFHDRYRVTNRHDISSDLVLHGHSLLQKHGVDYNILCVLNDYNVEQPDEVFQYLLNLGARWVQFIPAIEWIKDPTNEQSNIQAPYSPDPMAYGKFLCRVFNLWFEKYRGRISVRIFDAVLNKLVLGEMPFCILDGSCHNQLTIEHDGAVFGCDHFVESRWQLAKIGEPGWHNEINLDGTQGAGLTIHGRGYQSNAVHGGRDIHGESDLADRYSGQNRENEERSGSLDDTWFDRVEQPRLSQFAARKQQLPKKCVQCQWKPYCHGGCPKHRPHGGEVPEPTILCEAYIMFYEHAMPRLRWLAGYLQRGVQPPEPDLARSPTALATQVPERMAMGSEPRESGSGRFGRVGRNDACPCGSGLKYKRCHGKQPVMSHQ